MDVRDISWSTLRTQQRKRPSRPLFPNCSPCRYLLKVAVWPSEVEKEEVERVKHRQVVLGAGLRFLCKLETLQSLTPN